MKSFNQTNLVQIKQIEKKILWLKCVCDGEGGTFTLFDGYFIFTAAPKACFNYFEAVCNTLKLLMPKMEGKKEFLSSCVRFSKFTW